MVSTQISHLFIVKKRQQKKERRQETMTYLYFLHRGIRDEERVQI